MMDSTMLARPGAAAAILTTLSSACLLATAAPVSAQGIEIAPIAGVRAGGAEFITITGPHVDRGSTPALGVVVDVPLDDGLQFEGAFSHQRTGDVTTDHWQAGGLQEYFFHGRVRPFVTGVLGLTRYGVGGDNEVRFLAGAGGGVKLWSSSRVGLRVDGRLFATILDAQGTRLFCSGNSPCFVQLHVHAAWQGEFTAGLVVRLP
jgi:hypothetical protein